MSLNRIALLVALLALCLVGCGGDSSSGYTIPASSEFKPFVAPETDQLVSDSEYDEEVEEEEEEPVPDDEDEDEDEDADADSANKAAEPATPATPATPAPTKGGK